MYRYRVPAWTFVFLITLGLPQIASAVPSFARQTGKPCSQCHTLSFGPALTEYGRQFKLNGYTFTGGENPFPIAFMTFGGYSRTSAAQPAPPVDDFKANDNVSVDQVGMFIATRITDHLGVFAQSTYSGEKRHYNWDNTDLRYARPTNFLGTDAIVGISINNNPTVQDVWTSTPGWGFPYVTSVLVPTPGANPIITGALAQLVVGATAYTLIHDHVYLEAGAYRGLSDRWLGNVGLYPSNNPHVSGAAPYWRAAYQWKAGAQGEHYFSVGTFGLDVKLQPDPTVPDTNRFTDAALDATYQYTPSAGGGAILANFSYTHEKQDLTATFNAGGAASPTNHLDVIRLDASYAYHQTWSAGVGVFDSRGGTDTTFYGPNPLIGSNNGTPDSRGYILQFECVPLGKMESWGRPWINLRIGVQYTGYLKFNGGTTNYDGFGRNASDNNSLYVFSWLAF